MHSSSADNDLLIHLASSNLIPAVTRCILQYTNSYKNVFHRKEVIQYRTREHDTALTSTFNSLLIARAIAGKASNRKCTPWHTYTQIRYFIGTLTVYHSTGTD